jgi:16S rRNA (cytosine967-C5)-methyltransferase
VQADGTVPPFREASFDAVLVDAPCTGLGALRRRPDARWRIEADAVDRLADLQVDLVRAAAPLVAPGGTLVYSVCTLTRAESVGVVRRVGDRLAALGLDLAGHVDATDAGAAPWTELDPGVGLLLPGPDHDGMCRSVWHRR